MPTLRDEEWRRTDLKGLKMDSVIPYGPVLDEQGIPAEIADVLENAEERGGLFIQHDASTIHAEVAERLRSQGVILTDLATAMREHEDLVRPHFMTEAVPAKTNKFTALHGAFWSGGTFVYVPKGVTVDLPIHSVYWATTPHLGAFPHTLVIVDAGASLNLVDEYASAESDDAGLRRDGRRVDRAGRRASRVREPPALEPDDLLLPHAAARAGAGQHRQDDQCRPRRATLQVQHRHRLAGRGDVRAHPQPDLRGQEADSSPTRRCRTM